MSAQRIREKSAFLGAAAVFALATLAVALALVSWELSLTDAKEIGGWIPLPSWA